MPITITGASVTGGALITVPNIATDPYFPYVPLLLEPTSTNAQTNNTFLDSSTNNFTITRNGTPTQGSVTPYWPNGQWSNYFSGSGEYLTLAASNTFNFAGDFTIEAWVYPTTINSNNNIISRWQTVGGTSSTLSFIFKFVTGGRPYFAFYSGTTYSATGTTTAVIANQWNHIAVARSGSTVKFFVNGIQDATTLTISGTPSATNTLTIGALSGAGDELITGYMSNLRVVNGTAVYTGNFTPPTTPLTAITNTSLLTCQSNRFIDNSTNAFAITANGSPKVQAFQPFPPNASYTTAAYGGSGYFNGSSDYLLVASNAAFGFETGDFTIECWAYVANTSNQMMFVDIRAAIGSVAPLVYMTSSGVVNYYTGGAVVIAGVGIIANSWNHIAVSRSATSTKLFVNGAQAGSTYTDNNNYIQSSVFIARAADVAGFYLNGYVSNVRIVKGTAVYTANFTPPTAPLTAITNTQLLLNYTNAGIYDAAVQNNVITVGDAQASTTQYKWSPTSMKYDGTGDWLTAIDSPQLQLGTGDFTIDGWVYLSATGVAYGIISKGTASTGWSVNVTSGNKLQFSYTASNLTGATSLASATWYYFAVVRSGSATENLKIYLNGTADATSGGAVTDNFNQTSTLYVGADRVGGSALNGYLQDVRITKGVARTITSSPTSAFPTQ